MKAFKKILVNIMAVATLFVAMFSFTACAKEEIISVEIKIGAYNTASSAMFEEDLTLTVDLYRHLAPQTVDKIVEYIKETENNIYKDAIFYTEDNAKTILFGDLKQNEEGISQIVKPEIYGEFKSNGTVGSNLKNKKGSVGLLRSNYVSESNFTVSSDSRDSGRATWYLPTESISAYDGFTCIFGLIDLQVQSNLDTLDAIKEILKESEYYDSYVVYYTGEYDAEDKQGNHGLEFHCVSKTVWDEGFSSANNKFNGQEIFVAEGQQLKSYNHHNIKLPKTTNVGQSYAQIKSITIK